MEHQPYIPLNHPALDVAEELAVLETIRAGALAGDGRYCRLIEARLREMCDVPHALLTTSCTHALEMAMLALDLRPGDEVIMPSFTFSSTANAVALRGAIPIFVDIDPQTWNIDPLAVEAAITPRTRGVMPVHYAGQGCDMVALTAIAERHGLWIVEDAAQGIGAAFAGRSLGAWGTFGCISFHNTKNIVAGEGGALLTSDTQLAQRAEIMREKGTNRAAFFRGEVDKYTWVEIGSSYVISDLLAAVLHAQMGKIKHILAARVARWQRYQAAFEPLGRNGIMQLPVVHPAASINGHVYAFLIDPAGRDNLLAYLRQRGIGATFHYVPLHSAPAAARFGPPSVLPITDRVSSSLVRLPLYHDLADEDQEYIVATVYEAIEALNFGPYQLRSVP
jgi:dTDP-4-amino-4,6-dideoxygalactose transaminase